jgi:hypothetical protein
VYGAPNTVPNTLPNTLPNTDLSTDEAIKNSSGSKASNTLNRFGTDLHDCGFSRY